MDTLAKLCAKCKQEKKLDDFYPRSGVDEPYLPGHFTSECKQCMKDRNKTADKLSPYEPRVFTEKVAIEKLRTLNTHAIPGKAVAAADVDVVCWGCVWVEVKYAKLEFERGAYKFKFTASPKQSKRGFLADLVMLVCEYPGERLTYHLFEATDDVFYIHGRVKTGWTFTPGAHTALKHGNNRTVLTQPLMDAAEERWELIEMFRLLRAKDRMAG